MSPISRRDFLYDALALSLAAMSPGIMKESAGADRLLMHNGKIATLEANQPWVEALLAEDGVIRAVGTSREILALANAGTQIIDLEKRTVIPGLCDSHLHFVRGSLSYNLDTRWDGVPSLKEALAKLTAQAARTPEGQWVRVGGGWSEFQFAEKRMPTLAELNEAVPDRPGYVLHFYQSSLLNRKGMEALGYSKRTSAPSGGRIEHDGKGNPTGMLVAHPFPAVILAPETKMPGLSAADQSRSITGFCRELNRLGITSIVDPGGVGQPYPEMYDALIVLANRGELSLRVAMYLLPQDAGRELRDIQEWTKSLKLHASDSFRLAGAGEILAADGTDWDLYTQPRVGMPATLAKEIKPIVEELVRSSWPFRCHATFDATMSKYLDIFETVNRSSSLASTRWCFDHAELALPGTLERIGNLGGGIAVQHRAAFHGEYAVKYYGAAAMQQAPPLRRMLDLKIPVGAGTDATRDTSYNPWVSLKWLVTGKTVGGLQLAAEENRLSREEALRLYTLGSAWFSGQEEKKGSLQKGKFADLAVLSEDFFTVNADSIDQIEAVMTVVSGRIVHAQGPFASLAPVAPAVSPVWSPAAISTAGYYRR